MGKKRITQLLEQLEANRQAELENAAAIFTVAQVAVNKLQEQVGESSQTALLPAATIDPAAEEITQATLREKYGSHQACRAAAKAQGIRFSKNPTWEQLVVAFRYAAQLRQVANDYLQAQPHPAMRGVTIELRF
ncbi:MAG TPA: hypothetical protein IGS53_23545 [Leptolyngbyaceae cyanobacterium M33_DOE_097]|uniref:Uncharacterized protein n=1 Tax=Oscillatoriales cyanobacterium SpSt-418 TaxID=2282169 RepID=A0A7C3KCI5_9CYAN|nr:hypothetical protein [Leptolyngbyaceae cyanobacterium M33_DOE_097]